MRLKPVGNHQSITYSIQQILNIFRAKNSNLWNIDQIPETWNVILGSIYTSQITFNPSLMNDSGQQSLATKKNEMCRCQAVSIVTLIIILTIMCLYL